MLFYNTLKQKLHEVCHYFMNNTHPSLRGAAFRRRSNLLAKLGIASSFLAMTLFLVACLPLNRTSATEPPLSSETPLPTSTIIWFPASATPTLKVLPTTTATPEMNPGIGEAIFTDDFSDAKLWDTVNSEQASAIIKDQHLTLAIEPGASIASLRRDVTLSNFYAEITARIGLCRAGDNYGIIIRATGDSFYRFILACNGLIQVERIKSSVRLTLSEPVASADVPMGAPGEVRIGIWAVGGEMRLFLNGRYQFTITEKTLPSGVFGVFAQSKGDTPVTVTFSDLKVYDVDYIAPTLTPSP